LSAQADLVPIDQNWIDDELNDDDHLGLVTFESGNTYRIDQTTGYDGDVAEAPARFYGCYIWGDLVIEDSVIVEVVGYVGEIAQWELEDRPDSLFAAIRVISFGENTGSIVADGTSGDGVTTFRGTTNYETWNGIRMENGAGESSFNYCDFDLLMVYVVRIFGTLFPIC